MLKPIYARLPKKEHAIKNSRLQGTPNNSVHIMYQIQFICLIVWDLRYMISSQYEYQQKVIFVTFVLNMTVKLPVEKKNAILKLYFKSISKRSPNTIREFSR